MRGKKIEIPVPGSYKGRKRVEKTAIFLPYVGTICPIRTVFDEAQTINIP